MLQLLVHLNKECEVLINLHLQECIRNIILEPLNCDLILDQPIVASTPEVAITQIHSPLNRCTPDHQAKLLVN